MKRPMVKYTCTQCGYVLYFTFRPAGGIAGIRCPGCQNPKRPFGNKLRRFRYSVKKLVMRKGGKHGPG